MQIQVAAAKAAQYAVSESGDTLEMIERPQGGLSLVLADGQRSGYAAKSISTLVTSKAISLLAEGVRDGAAARATHDYLYTARRGKVSATLNIVSVDMVTKTLVLSRNSNCPIVVQLGPGEQYLLDDPAPPIGVHRIVKPQIEELPLRTGMMAVVYTDGILGAGERSGNPIDVPATVAELYVRYAGEPQIATPVADTLLAEAIKRDEGRPRDDMSVVVVTVAPEAPDDVRRLQLTFPIPPVMRP
ncbi:MAG TPA: PP2C family protein-serine/threonine phosphatase [Aggregatilineales bacterium]|nr:PP2C family protein-serine/threonine phosphatase [Aggregatilineales bacterium]